MKASNGTTGVCIACFLMTGLAQAAAVYSSLQHVANIGHATISTVHYGFLSFYCIQDSVHEYLQLPARSQQCDARLLFAHMLDKVCIPQHGSSWTADTGSVSFDLCGLAARLLKLQSLHVCIQPQWLQAKDPRLLHWIRCSQSCMKASLVW